MLKQIFTGEGIRLHTEEIYHHGILGQKWGVRRFQNKNGSLTTAGKSRRKKQKGNEHIEPLTEEKKAHIIKTGDVKSAHKYVDDFSNDELNQVMNRYTTTTKLSSLANADLKQGKDFAEKMSKRLNMIANVTNSAANIYGNIQRISETSKKMSGDGEKKDKTMYDITETFKDASGRTVTSKYKSDKKPKQK